VFWLFLSRRRVFLVDFAVFRAPSEWETSHDYFKSAIRAKGSPFPPEAVRFMDKILDASGLGPATAMPPTLRQAPPPWAWRLEDAKAESEAVIFEVVEKALAAAGVRPSAVDVLVVNCSLFNPTPSLSAMVVARFGMRAGIASFNLGGMGCSAGLIALDLARELLASRPAGQVALVVSTENITTGLYQGTDRSMLIPACIFRVGGSAVVLSNAGPFSRLRRAAKYELTHLVRTHRGADARAHACVAQATDPDGVVGVRLSKDLMAVAGAALKANITALGPLVLPVAEQAHFLARCALRRAASALGKPVPPPYVPDFSTAFDHFCVHTGGRAVLEEVASALRLSPEAARPSAATLWRNGNTSSSSIWYVLAWIESSAAVAARAADAVAAGAPGPRVPPVPPSCAGLPPPRPIRKGDRVWQIAFGSGFKCNSAVLKARRAISQVHAAYDDFE
jgi:3-ketoacyl-CoA synthase